METTMHLLDRIGLNLLQNLQDAFAESLGTRVAFVDARRAFPIAPNKRDVPRGSDGRAGVPPAVIMMYVAGVCLGQWLIGGARPHAVPPDVRSLVFMPLETDQGMVGALGFAQKTIRDWPPEALARLWVLAGETAGNLKRNTAGEKRDFSPGCRGVILPA